MTVGGPPGPGDAMAAARRVLSEVFGFAAFRPGQERVIEALLAGSNTLAVMPTGSGKSLCFQVPALVKDGLTVVVSPLVALMQDQVAALRLAGVAADAIHSGNDRAGNEAAWRRVEAGATRLLYMAPERLMTERMLGALTRLPVRLFAIDEAHCISQWGPAFRPEYADLCRLRDLFPGVPLAALTANRHGAVGQHRVPVGTANRAVVLDDLADGVSVDADLCEQRASGRGLEVVTGIEWGQEHGRSPLPIALPGIGAGDPLPPPLPGTRPARAVLYLYDTEAARRIATSRSQTDRGGIDPRLSTGMPWASAMRMAMPVPPVAAPPALQHTTASTGRSRVSESKSAAFLACSLWTAGVHRSQAGCRGAATSIHADNAAEDSTWQLGSRCPL